jgi:hypothetical protein
MTVFYSDLNDLFYIRDGDGLRWFETEREARAAETHGYTARIKALEAENERLRKALHTRAEGVSIDDTHTNKGDDR